MATFQIGQEVQSAPNSGDIDMGDVWVARVIEIRTGVDGTSDGCCYVTVGRWASEPDATPTSRQLWADHIVARDGGTAVAIPAAEEVPVTGIQQQTRGASVRIDFGDGKVETFTAGGGKRFMLNTEWEGTFGPVGFVYVNGTLRLADGTLVYAVLGISEPDSCEHSDTGVFAPGGKFVWQGDDDFCSALGKTKDEVFPYKYRYDAELNASSDHHVGAGGWSL
jgi:hypothetical protein